MTNKTISLLHGAGTGAWVWERVVPLLPSPTLPIDVPSRSRDATPESCAANIVTELDRQGAKDIILVMHSLAGVLAAELAARLGGRLLKCVYVSAVVPEEGATFAKALGFPARILLPFLFRLHPEGLMPSEKMIRRELCSDLPEKDCELVVSRYAAEFSGLYLSKVAGPPALPSTYVKLTEDRSVPPAQQATMIRRLESPSIYEIEAGHLVMLSRPRELAEVLWKTTESA